MEIHRVKVLLKVTITKKRKHTCEMSGPERDEGFQNQDQLQEYFLEYDTLSYTVARCA